jgi:uncharacterized protein YjiS (DUF1127 family)
MVAYSTAKDSLGATKRPGRYRIALRHFLGGVAARRLRQRQRAQLHALSDRVLADIGISRWEIDSIIGRNRDASGRVR